MLPRSFSPPDPDQPLPQRLRAVLRDLAEEGERASDNPFHALIHGERTLRAQLCGHLLALAVELLQRGNGAPRTLDCALDLSETARLLVMHEAATEALGYVVQRREARGLSSAGALQLSLDHLEQVGAYLTDQARACALTLPGELRPGSALHCAPDPHATLPRDIPLGELRPAGASGALEGLLAGGHSEIERGAVCALMWLRARATYHHGPVVALLQLAAQAISVAQDLRREARQDPGPVRELHREVLAVQRELGIRIRGLSPLPVVRTHQRAECEAHLRALLHEFTSGAQGHTSGEQHTHEGLVWINFDRLDGLLQEHHTENDAAYIDTLVLITAVHALVATERAPGMALSPTVELAVTLSGIDPLWGWDAFQTRPQERLKLLTTLNLLDISFYVLWRSPHQDNEPFRMLEQVSSHLFAQCARLGLRLPEHDRLAAFFFAGAAPPRLTPLNESEFEALRERCLEQLWAIPPDDTCEAPPPEDSADGDTPGPDAAPPAEPPAQSAAPHPPEHVVRVRELLSGRSITLLGGVRKPHHHAALEAALGCAVDWIESAAYDHGAHAAAHIQPGTGVVVLAVRWMAHAHGGLREVARERGVPYVMHPGGLSPSSVAYQILRQVGRRLSAP